MKSTPTDVLESELLILPIDPYLKELQQHEAVKLLIKMITSNPMQYDRKEQST